MVQVKVYWKCKCITLGIILYINQIFDLLIDFIIQQTQIGYKYQIWAEEQSIFSQVSPLLVKQHEENYVVRLSKWLYLRKVTKMLHIIWNTFLLLKLYFKCHASLSDIICKHWLSPVSPQHACHPQSKLWDLVPSPERWPWLSADFSSRGSLRM